MFVLSAETITDILSKNSRHFSSFSKARKLESMLIAIDGRYLNKKNFECCFES